MDRRRRPGNICTPQIFGKYQNLRKECLPNINTEAHSSIMNTLVGTEKLQLKSLQVCKNKFSSPPLETNCTNLPENIQSVLML
jgi:hypothetical protein